MCVRAIRRSRTPRNSLACDFEHRTVGQRSQFVKTQTALGTIGLILCVFTTVAHAGPANRRASSQPPPNYPINLNGFGAPLPAVSSSTSDLSTFATGQLNFKEID